MIDQINCPVCGETKVQLKNEFEPQYFVDKYKSVLVIDVQEDLTEIEKIDLIRCANCTHEFYLPLSLEAKPSFYRKLHQTSLYYQTEKWEFNAALDEINPDEKVLEVGCGEGNFLKMAASKGIEIIGLDTESSLNELTGEEIQIQNETIEEHAIKNIAYYDVLVSFQVLEHIGNVQSFVESCLKVLKPGGKLMLAVPNNHARILKLDEDNCLNMPPHHLQLFNPRSLGELASSHPMICNTIIEEPLQEDNFKRYYRINIVHIRKKYGLFGRIMDKLIYPISESLINLLQSNFKGQSMLGVFTKINAD